jgi:hypothetical protein
LPAGSVVVSADCAPESVTLMPTSGWLAASATRPPTACVTPLAAKSPVWSACRLLKVRLAGVKVNPVSEGVTVKLPPCARPVKE